MVLGLEFEVPIFVIQGTKDDYTPAALSRAYVDALHAPTKEFVPIDGAGHFAIVSRPDEFLNAMKARLRRITASSPPARAREETFANVVVNAAFVDTGASPMTPK
ncbi:MAG TPA: alpha/beta hydrolase [Vicinamibacterales bacterium]|nr:alpha/beta hydrolase [Vicinamibacterales bacterium]